jgi:hypothetical protein
VSIQQVQKYTSGTIRRQLIRCRLQVIEIIFSVLVTLELPSQIVIRLVLGVLEIVFPVRRCLPDVNHSTRNSLSSQEIGDFAMHQGRVSTGGGVLDNVTAERTEWGVGRPEGAKDGRRSGVCAFRQELVGNFVDESADVSFWCNLKNVRVHTIRDQGRQIFFALHFVLWC